MFTKTKRILAKIGIGNPLNQLIYTSKEIALMPKYKLEKVDGRKFSYHKGRHKKEIGDWAVRLHSGIIVLKRFKEKDSAERWLKWNYKNRDAGTVIKI